MKSSKSGGVGKAVKGERWIRPIDLQRMHTKHGHDWVVTAALINGGIRVSVGDLVESLFTNGGGEKATRLVLMDDDNGLDLGSLCRSAVRDRILEAIRSKPSRPAPRQKR